VCVRYAAAVWSKKNTNSSSCEEEESFATLIELSPILLLDLFWWRWEFLGVCGTRVWSVLLQEFLATVHSGASFVELIWDLFVLFPSSWIIVFIIMMMRCGFFGQQKRKK
jgi:hypothetical protein